MANTSKKVLLIGWDAADWKIINRLIDNGEMPAMKSMVENGVMGNISTLNPPYSPMLWTTIATGKYPDKHGILGFSEPTPDHSSIRPVSNSSRKVKAIWNILSQNGYKTHVINWWPSFPAEPINGICVSDMYHKISTMNLNNWKLPNDSVHPTDLQDIFSHFRVHPLELSASHLLPFIPSIINNTVKLNKKIEIVSRLVAEASTVQAAATLALEQEEWNFAAIYWDTIDHFCHSFMNYSPPQMKGIKDEDFELYKHVVDGAYRLMDLMLARLLELAGEECTVILTSDHGFQSGSLRQLHTPHEPAGPAFHHRNVGVFCAKGPGIRKDENIYGASLLDITPTILSVFGLPVGEDMDGKPLVEIFNDPQTINTIPSWEDVAGECGMLPDEKRDLDPEHSAEAIKQLIALGYIDDPGTNMAVAVERTIDELDYNLAVVYYSTSRRKLAMPILEKLFNKYPYRGRYLFKLVNCYIDEGDIEFSEKIISKFRSSAEDKIMNPDQIIQLKKRKVPEILTKKEKSLWIRENKLNPIKESTQAKNDLVQLKITEAELLFLHGKTKKALHKYKEIEKEIPKNRTFIYQMGKAYLKTMEWKAAKKLFCESILLDPDHANSHLGLGISMFNMEKYEEALESFLNAASLNFYDQITHFNIGRTLVELGKHENALKSFETALRIDPNHGLARNALIDLYENLFNDTVKANALKNKSEQAVQINDSEKTNEETLIIKPRTVVFNSEPIIVVSGLPRSGTSMMMQMLEAGGLPVFTDNERKPDENNPKGYLEHEKVKQLIRNNLWLGEATGKAVKIVVPLLYKIPASFNYKIIFMMRNMDEIIESQHQMLIEGGKIQEGRYAMGLEITYHKYLKQLELWSSKNRNVAVLVLNYHEIIENTTDSVEKISHFLDCELNCDKMKNCILPELYRVKK